MKYKAKYIGCIRDDWKHTELFYEYRGHEYCVTKHNNGYMDKSLKQQHEEAQAKIDYKIEHKNDEMLKYSGKCENAINSLLEFWEK